MVYRPYPSLDRARHQLDRHTRPATVAGLDALRRWSMPGEQAMANIAAALRVLPSVRALPPALVSPAPGTGT